MRANIRILLPLLFFMLLASCAGPKFFNIAANAPRYDKYMRVAVMSFSAKEECKDAGESLASMISSELIPYYVMIEREQIQRVLNEQGLAVGGVINESMIPQIGKLLGVQGLILGRVIQFEKFKVGKTDMATVKINIRMVDTQSGALIWSINLDVTGKATFPYDLCDDVTKDFIYKFKKQFVR